MKVNYIGKKTVVKDSFKEYFEKKFIKLEKFFDDTEDVTVVVTNRNEDETVEVTIKSHGMFFRAEKTTDDRFASVDCVIDILTNQIVKNKTRLAKKNKNFDIKNSIKEFYDETIEDDEEEKILVKKKSFTVDVMDVEEAILQMNLLNHQFFMFRSDDTGEINVVYRRKDGNYGVIEPAK